MGNKIPRALRPIASELKNKIPQSVLDAVRPLLIDIQNDCFCSEEKYNAMPGREALVLKNDSPCLLTFTGDSIAVPIHEQDPSAHRIKSFFEAAASLSCEQSYLDKELCSSTIIHQDSEFKFYAPEPEYFGCFTLNLRGWGAYCLPGSIFKKKS